MTFVYSPLPQVPLSTWAAMEFVNFHMGSAMHIVEAECSGTDSPLLTRILAP